MELIHLRTDMKNCSIAKNSFRWDFKSLEFHRDSHVALSSLTIDFKSKLTNSNPIRLTLSLIDNSVNNPDGTIVCFASKAKDLSHSATNLEFWKMDSVRPRSIKLTLPGHDTSNVLFMSVVLAIRNE